MMIGPSSGSIMSDISGSDDIADDIADSTEDLRICNITQKR